MHTILIVLLDRSESVDSSGSARREANARLEGEGFVGASGLFSDHPADWFVIGGRWSGELTAARLDQAKVAALFEKLKSQKLDWVTQGVVGEERERKAGEIFKEIFPDYDGEPLLNRDPYQMLGYTDDAQLLDETLYTYLGDCLRYPEETGLINLQDGHCFVDLDDPDGELTKEAIGKKWVVVVDFHY